MLPGKLRKLKILPVNQNILSVYFSPSKFQLVSCNLFLVMVYKMTFNTHKLPKLCLATIISNYSDERRGIKSSTYGIITYLDYMLLQF